ncbi:hypothetical protein LTR17_007504 [Elasticomyces elasticus]|nr:hypothetical protein LTR17_007504 [Elasticomyces elasticus]
MATSIEAPHLRRYPQNEQNTIHPLLFKPTNDFFYGGTIKNKPGDFKLPVGWHRMLRSMMDSRFKKPIPGSLRARLHWFEVTGDNVQISHEDGPNGIRSSANFAHHLLVVKTILPALRALYGTDLRSRVKIVIPYEQQREVYRIAFMRLEEQGWSEDEIPQVWTVTAAQHHDEWADVVILDVVKSKGGYGGLGFLMDDDRIAIMFTRAKKACFVVSGDLESSDDSGYAEKWSGKDVMKWEVKNSKRATSLQRGYPDAITYYRDEARRYGCLSSHAAMSFHPLELLWAVRPKQMAVITPQQQMWLDLNQKCIDAEMKEKQRKEDEEKEKKRLDDEKPDQECSEAQVVMRLVAGLGGPDAVRVMISEIRSQTRTRRALEMYYTTQGAV